jgi:hypothetical protein
LCRLWRGEQEEWSGSLRTDEDRWIVHSDLGDDEPIRILHLNTLRPGDYIRLRHPEGDQVSFRIEQVTRTHGNSGKTLASGRVQAGWPRQQMRLGTAETGTASGTPRRQPR